MTAVARGSTGAPGSATALLVLGVAATFMLTGIQVWLLLGDVGGDASIALLAPAMLAYATLGWTILRSRPDHRVGWVLLATPPLVNAVFFGFTLSDLVTATGLPTAIVAFGAWLAVVLFAPAILLVLAALGLLFPDGRLPGPRWRWPVRLVVGVAIAASAMLGLASGELDSSMPPNPFAVPFLPQELRLLGSFLVPIAIVAGTALAIASMAVRLRRSRGVERQQMKWMLAAIASVAVLTVPTFVADTPAWVGVASSLSLVLIPGAATIAILRYRLYEIDRLISRTLGWAIVTGLLAAVFGVAVVGLQAVLSRFVPGSTLAVAASTLLVLALFQRLRSRVQRAVDRRFNRASYDAQDAADAFAGRLRGLMDLGGISDELLGAVGDALEPRAGAIWLRRTATIRPAPSRS